MTWKLKLTPIKATSRTRVRYKQVSGRPVQNVVVVGMNDGEEAAHDRDPKVKAEAEHVQVGNPHIPWYRRVIRHVRRRHEVG